MYLSHPDKISAVAVAKMGDCLDTIDMDRKVGRAAVLLSVGYVAGSPYAI